MSTQPLSLYWTLLLNGRLVRDAAAGLLALAVLTLAPASLLWTSVDLGGYASITRLQKQTELAISKGAFDEARLHALRLAGEPAQRDLARLLLARIDLARGDHLRLRASLRSWCPRLEKEQDPLLVEALVLLVESLLTGPEGSGTLALEHLARSLSLNPKHPGANEWAARVAAERGKWTEVLDHLSQTPLPSRPDLRLLQASALWSLGRKDAARAIALQIEESLPSQTPADASEGAWREFKARCLALQSQFGAALTHLPMPSPSGQEPALSTLRLRSEIVLEWARDLHLSRVAPPGAILGLLEQYLLGRGRAPEAMRVFAHQTAQALVSPIHRPRLLDPATPAHPMFHYWYQAFDHLRLGHVKQANEALANAWASDPEFVSMLLALLEAWDPLDTAAVPTLAQHNLTLLAFIQTRAPHLPGLKATAATVLQQHGRLEEAAQALRESIWSAQSTNPATSAARLASLLEQLGFQALAEGALSQAARCFEEAHEWQPVLGRLQVNQALAWCLQPENQEAGLDHAQRLEWLSTADPDNLERKQTLALVYYQLGQHEKARQRLADGPFEWQRDFLVPRELLLLQTKAWVALQKPERH